MLNFCQVCHGVGRSVIAGLFFVKLGVKVNGKYYWDVLQNNVTRYQTCCG